MSKAIKNIALTIFIGVVTIVTIIMYWGRNQQIDFTSILPNEVTHCDVILNQSSPNYISLSNWFKDNTQGWENTPVTYVPISTYTAPNISVNVMGKGVVVNYQTKDGNWVQVVNHKDASHLVNQCAKANKSFKRDLRFATAT